MAAFTIIGNGAAGTTAAEQIRERDREGAIRIITDEDTPFYYRIRLNEFLAGDINEDKLRAKGGRVVRGEEHQVGSRHARRGGVTPAVNSSPRNRESRSHTTSFSSRPGVIPSSRP